VGAGLVFGATEGGVGSPRGSPQGLIGCGVGIPGVGQGQGDNLLSFVYTPRHPPDPPPRRRTPLNVCGLADTNHPLSSESWWERTGARISDHLLRVNRVSRHSGPFTSVPSCVSLKRNLLPGAGVGKWWRGPRVQPSRDDSPHWPPSAHPQGRGQGAPCSTTQRVFVGDYRK
jgi:hypothetical protein